MKKILTTVLLLFVGVSLLVAVADVAGWRRDTSTESISASADQATHSAVMDTATPQFTAMYFHALHRCPTCKKIEAYAHDALQSEIEQGKINWEVANYTADTNKHVVEKCNVLTSTVVLLERKGGQIVRWRNLEGVWNHTDDPEAFAAYVNASWDEFKKG